MPLPSESVDARLQQWPWWPLLPLYPYGRRPTLMRELIAGKVWCLEQLHGVWYVAVPIRMTVLKVEGGLMLYAPLPPTAELRAAVAELERQHGPVLTIVLATSSGLEHKLPAASLSRAFPAATLWVSDHQWSFPLQLPSTWLGFPAARTRVLLRDGVPHGEQLSWIPLGPLNLGLGTFLELACFDRNSGSLLVTDALVGLSATPPAMFELDPLPLLVHARERGTEPLHDSPEQRRKGWKRILLFANFFRPSAVSVASLPALVGDAWATPRKRPVNHFGLYPFRWASDWEERADRFLEQQAGSHGFCLAPVLERLVFVRCREAYLRWLGQLAQQEGIQQMIGAHYETPTLLSQRDLEAYRESLEARPWAPSTDSWQLLAAIDQTLVNLRLVPS